MINNVTGYYTSEMTSKREKTVPIYISMIKSNVIPNIVKFFTSWPRMILVLNISLPGLICQLLNRAVLFFVTEH